MTPTQFEDLLRQTLEDHRLSRSERRALSEVIAEASLDARMRGVYRSVAFRVARESLQPGPDRDVLAWLEGVNKLLLPPTRDGRETHAEAYFSPGDATARAIARLTRQTRRRAELCIYTITDDRVAGPVLEAHARGVQVRLITEGSKELDLGSDVPRMRDAGIPVRIDTSEHLMHHKFAIFDGAELLTGSYNWTRSAADFNQENFIVTNYEPIVRTYAEQFERLWTSLA